MKERCAICLCIFIIDQLLPLRSFNHINIFICYKPWHKGILYNIQKEKMYRNSFSDLFLKHGGFKVHYFEKNNIDRIKQLINKNHIANQQALPTDTLSTHSTPPEKEDSVDNSNEMETSENQVEQQQKLTIKKKVQNIIKLTMTTQQQKVQSENSIRLNKAIFKQKIKEFIESFKPSVTKTNPFENFINRGSQQQNDKQLTSEDQFQQSFQIEQSFGAHDLFVKKKRRKRQGQTSYRKRKKLRLNKKLGRPISLQLESEIQFDQQLPKKTRITRNSLKNNNGEKIQLQMLQMKLETPKKTLKATKSKCIAKDMGDKKAPKGTSTNKTKKIAVDQEYRAIQEGMVIKESSKIMVQRSQTVEIKQAKKIQKKRQKQSESSRSDYALMRYEELLISNLPSRNPITRHLHNSIPNESVSLIDDLKSNILYYASQILHYNAKNGQFTVSCTKDCLSFVDESFRSTRNCKNIPMLADSDLKKIKLKRNFEYKNKKILVLDLDETLVHSQGLNEIPNKEIFPFHFDFDHCTRHYSIRNYAQQFIKNLAERYYIVVFTSALQGYADCIIDHLDPHEIYIQHRLYRTNCYLYGQSYPYIKDLRILNRDLSQVIIVDNSLYAYWFHLDNGVPIIPFLGIQDEQLIKLQRYLLKLQNVDDVRKINRRAFHMHLFEECNNSVEYMARYCDQINIETGCGLQKEKKDKKGREKDKKTKQKDKKKILIDQE